ncbi:exodeoxyribonuclease VII large subunit [Pullulanibacillus sp. KACC 23026]|uniref:exodeoxyribonuclease VII large subunit n=1 Tax=Pullulanibacillus sp. KACC 23026 TaxID=3028315 RepID=UPI0023AEC003|nr:exodeoxyribonuclease VII large subunit [Pullulanibacillus sp. KACC 23026]WEG14319.1 exodeoxyribonuclease VII large subunit [Pullulanibacillus sp. KACC 23026]
MTEQKAAITITQLTRYLKRVIEGNRHLQDVWLRGEISNFKRHSRGHMYLTLKDEQSRLQAVMFAADNARLLFKPEDGMKVLVRGQVSVYEPYGQYQLYIKEMQQDGIGNLYLAFEQLKKKLEEEGLFDPQFKKPLPAYPNKIGVITSPTGAAIRDVFTTIKRRFPRASLFVFPVHVQGELAAPAIVKAIETANALRQVDVLIVGRGGGSIEDLWAFNEEKVARAIFQSALPIISAVGHETDFTIADFVADVRAATPTAAAELAVPHLHDLEARLTDRLTRLALLMRNKLVREQERLKALERSYAFRSPLQLIRQKEQDLDRLWERLTTRMAHHVQKTNTALTQMDRLLFKHHPESQVNRSAKDLEHMTGRLTRSMAALQKTKQQSFRFTLSQLNALSPLAIMERGYSLTYKKGTIVKRVDQVQVEDELAVKLTDGSIDVKVMKKKGDNLND